MTLTTKRSTRRYWAAKNNNNGISSRILRDIKKLQPDETTIGVKLSTSPIPSAEVDVKATWEKRARSYRARK